MNRIFATFAIMWQQWQRDELWGVLPLLPSCGKSGKRMNYGVFATFAIMWKKWQKDELWDFCHFCHHDGKSCRNPIINRIFATFAIMMAKVAEGMPLWDPSATFAIMWQVAKG